MKQTSVRQGISAYRSSLKTVSPLVSVVRLYDGILARIGRAAAAAERGNTHEQLEHVIGAVQILNGLDKSLDMEAGGRVAVSLRDMYGAVALALYNSVGSSVAVEASEKIAAAVRKTRDAWAHIAGVDSQLTASGISTAAQPSAIVKEEQEMLRPRTSKKSAVHVRPTASQSPEPEPGKLSGPGRSVRGKFGSLA